MASLVPVRGLPSSCDLPPRKQRKHTGVIAEADHPACEHWRTGTEPLGHPTSVGADDLRTAPCRAWGRIPRHL
jgi:hypothetical protein